jgi:hypothetical protein
VLVLETSPPEIVGEQIGGVLGVEFFERFVVSLDYKANEVTFERPQLFTAAQREAAGIPVRFQFYDHMPQVAGTFDQLPARYNIDTGSGQFVTMTSPYVEKEKLRARYPDAVTIVDGFGTGGASRSSIVRARSLTLGQAKVERIPAGLSTAQHGSFSDPAYSGNVGNGVLRNFRVTFDYAHQTMYLKRVPNPDMSAYGYNRTGLTIVLKDGKPRIADVAAGTPAASTPIEPGDYLISVAGIDVAGKSLREVRDLLNQAPVGKPISIAYTRNGNELRTTLVPRDMLP